MRKIVPALGLAVLLSAGLSGAAAAKTFKLGDEKPLASIDMPDGWEPSPIEDGVEANSPDKETYVAAEVGEADDLDAAVKYEDKFFRKSKIKVKPETLKKQDASFGELKGIDYAWDAEDEDGPTHVSMTLLTIDPKHFMMITYWGSAAGEKSNAKALGAIAKSVKLLR